MIRHKEKQENTTKKSKKRRLIKTILIALLFFLSVIALDMRLKVVEYVIESDKIDEPVKIVLITDLHSCYYQKGMKTLVKAIDEQNPDLICIGGDFFDDDKKDDNAIKLLEAINGRYPIYYVAGNHEYWSNRIDDIMDTLKQYDIRILDGEYETVEIRGQKINICGVSDPDIDFYTHAERTFSDQLEDAEEALDNGYYSVLLSHRPEYFKYYVEGGFDLALCGHAHGGQWRIPGLVNGLFVPNQGLFPEYAGGEYVSGNTTMIISRGLARESTIVPRIFNRPELVVVTIQ